MYFDCFIFIRGFPSQLPHKVFQLYMNWEEQPEYTPQSILHLVFCSDSVYFSIFQFNFSLTFHLRSKIRLLTSRAIHVRELKQARTATAVNKQLNFTVKNKPHTTNYIYCIFEAYFMIKSVWKDCIDCFEVNLK